MNEAIEGLVEELLGQLETGFVHGPVPGLDKSLALCTCSICFPDAQPRARRWVVRRKAKVINMAEWKQARGRK